MNWWVSRYLDQGDYWLLYCHCFFVIASICLHELGHGYAALQQGDSTPRDYRRMTLNPLVHMGWFALAAFALFGITWGSMPINPARFRWGRWGEVWVAAAGPFVNLVLALLLLTTAGVVGASIGVSPLEGFRDGHKLLQALVLGGALNAALFAFNLLPSPPLDGGAIVAGLTTFTHRLYNSPGMQQFGFFILIVILATGIGGLVMGVGIRGGLVYAELLARLVSGFVGPGLSAGDGG
jgi:Zn-dependent protease